MNKDRIAHNNVLLGSLDPFIAGLASFLTGCMISFIDINSEHFAAISVHILSLFMKDEHI